MPIPSTVNICGYTYAITVVDEIGRENGVFLDGQITHHDLQIDIAKNIAKPYEQAVVLHEILHGLALLTGQLDLKHDEAQINALAFSLVTLLRNNPALVTYLTETT